jgi:ribonuclease BN (tRNA processing enzyme)
VAVEHGGARLILDAGTGLRRLGRTLGRAADPVDLLLTHAHWDHIQGLPFFAPLYQRGRTVRVQGPAFEGVSLSDVVRRQMAPPVWPIGVHGVAARLSVTEITAPEFAVANFLVRTVSLRHPGGALGFRVAPEGQPAGAGDGGGGAVAYCTDNELRAWEGEARGELVRFLRDCDTLIHDAMYDDREIAAHAGWGHSSATDVVDLAMEAGVRRLVLFHHEPDRSDADVDRLLDGARARARAVGTGLEIDAAADGWSFALP